MNENEKTLTLKEAAAFLGRHPETVRGYFKSGLIPARQLRQKGKPWEVTIGALEAFQHNPWGKAIIL